MKTPLYNSPIKEDFKRVIGEPFTFILAVINAGITKWINWANKK